MTPEQIREIFLANGFRIHVGSDDLSPYVYQAARALLEAARSTVAAPAQSVATIKRILIEQKLNDATGEPDDEAYNQAIDDCIAAIDETFEDAPASTAAPVVPEGFVPVPIEPTEQMITAGFSAVWFGDKDTSEHELERREMAAHYRAMLSAAPKPDA